MMRFLCQSSALQGAVRIPGSKSHTIRALAIAGMARGESVLEAPLISADTLSARDAIAALGAEVDAAPNGWCVRGCEARPRPVQPVIDTGNSGTTMRVMMGLCALLRDGEITLTGDEQVQRRPAGPLAAALVELGARVSARRGNGCPPFQVAGLLRGGRTALEAATSQYVTSLLLACPLAAGNSVVEVTHLNERPYVEMTLAWLADQGIRVEHDECRVFRIPGQQQYHGFKRRIPADFSSATFFLGAGALPDNAVTCLGLDMNDPQADRAVVEYLHRMGANVDVDADAGQVHVSHAALRGVELDMNATPDALPVVAVLGCFAQGCTRLRNVAHARLKETDRIAVMARELGRLGADIEERPDGLVVRESRLRGAHVDGHDDHRVVMALALAGLNCPGQTTIETAEAAAVTFPDFGTLMRDIGGKLEEVTAACPE